MNPELNQKIEQAKQGIARLHKIDSMLGYLEQEQAILLRKEKELKASLKKEDLDVEKLEGRSIASVFYTILGNREKHLDKERAEALSARMKYDQIVRDLQDISHQKEELAAERVGYENCERDYAQYYEQKKEQLLQESGDTAHKMLELTDCINQSLCNQKEIKEAVTAGNRVLESLDSALDSLSSAEGWGTWDILGGGLLADLEKHSNIDDAKTEAERTQKLLLKFRTELADIRIDSHIDIEIDGFTKFADFFFDGLIADWCVQSKIHDSQDSVENVKEQVENVLNKLHGMLTAENSNIEKWKAEMHTLIEQA